MTINTNLVNFYKQYNKANSNGYGNKMYILFKDEYGYTRIYSYLKILSPQDITDFMDSFMRFNQRKQEKGYIYISQEIKLH